MNKKGFIGDVAVIIGLMLLLGTVFIVGSKVMGEFNDEWQANEDVSNQSKEIVSDLEGRYVNLWDGAFMLIFGLLAVALVVSTAALGTRPEFFFITVVIAVFFVGAAAAVSNAFYDISNDSGLVEATNEFTFVPLIMNNLVEITLVLIGLLFVGLYVKARGII